MALLIAGCDEASKPEPEPTDPPTTEDTGHFPQPEPGQRFAQGVYEHADDPGCMPPPRRFAQTAFFFEPLGHAAVRHPAGAPMQRGFFIYGGEDEQGNALDDLWVFDLSRRLVQGCDWTLLDPAATGGFGVAEGALVYDQGLLYLVGGRELTVDGWTAHDAVDVMTVAGGGPFVPANPGPETTSVAFLESAVSCNGLYWSCVCNESGGCLLTDGSTAPPGSPVALWDAGLTPLDVESRRRAICEQVPLDWGTVDPVTGWPVTPDMVLVQTLDGSTTCSGGDLGFACLDDPFCALDGDLSYPDPGSYGGALPSVACGDDGPWPGRWSAGWAWDPAHRRLYSQGGSVGCTGGVCDQPLWQACADLDLGHGSSALGLHALNDYVTAYHAPPFTASPIAEYPDYVYLGPLQPDYREHAGARGIAGVVPCLDWTLDGGVSGSGNCGDHAGPMYVTWGGTLDQSLQPRQRYEVGEGLVTGSWDRLFGDDPLGAQRAADLRITGSWSGRILSDSLPGLQEWSTAAGVFDAAIAQVGRDHVVAMGGRGDGGAPSGAIQVLEVASGAVVESFVVPAAAGYGASAVYDPVDQRAWFYGAMSGGDLRWVEDSVDKPVRVTSQPTSVALTRVEHEVELDGTDPLIDPWIFRTGLTMNPQATGPGEFTQKVWLRIPPLQGMDEARIQSDLSVRARVVGSSDWFDLEFRADDEALVWDNGALLSPVVPLFSPFVLLPSAVALDVVVEVENLVPGDVGISADQRPAAVCPQPTTVVELADMIPTPARDLPEDQLWDGWWVQPGAFAFVRYVNLPAGYLPISAGVDAPCASVPPSVLDPHPAGAACVDQSMNQGPRHLPGHVALVMNDVVPMGTWSLAPTVDFGTGQVTVPYRVRGFRDECLGSDEGAVVQSLGSGSALTDALEFTLQRIGPSVYPDLSGPIISPDVALVFQRSTSPDGSVAGLQRGGIIQVMPFDSGGSIVVDRALSVQHIQGKPDRVAAIVLSTAAHEFAHTLTDHRSMPLWAKEGFAVLVQWERDPELHRNGMLDGLIYRVGGWIDEGIPTWRRLRNLAEKAPEGDDSHPDEPYMSMYAASPYLLSQASAAFYTSAPEFWLAFRQAHQVYPWSTTLLETLLDTEWVSLLGSHYAERFLGGKVGEPLLGIVGAPGIDGLHLTTASSATITVRQVQALHLTTDKGNPFGTFSDVPFSVGCSTFELATDTNANGPQPFLECNGSVSGPYASVRTTSAAAETLVFTQLNPQVSSLATDVEVAKNTQAFDVSLVAHHLLWPGHIGTVHVDDITPGAIPSSEVRLVNGQYKNPKQSLAPFRKRLCTPEACSGAFQAPACCPDGDGDGFPSPSDANDGDAAVHPGAPYLTDAQQLPVSWEATDTTGVAVQSPTLPNNRDVDGDSWPLDFWRMVDK